MCYPAWLLFLSDVSIESFFFDMYIPFDCKFMVAQKTDQSVRLTEVYMVADKTPLLLDWYATWSDDTTNHPLSALYERRNQLHGIKLKGTTLNVSIR